MNSTQAREFLSSLSWTGVLHAHVPEPPEHDPNVPPDAPPPGAPDHEVDLPPREEPDTIRDPEPPDAEPPMRAARIAFTPAASVDFGQLRAHRF